MDDYHQAAIQVLTKFKHSARLRYQEFMLIDKAIEYLDKDYDPDEEPPYFQISVRKRDWALKYYLIFSEEHFKMQTFHHEHDHNYYPVDITINYERGYEEESDGYVEDWEREALEYLEEYDPSDEDNEIELNFSNDY